MKKEEFILIHNIIWLRIYFLVNAGRVTAKRVETRPVLRPSEVLEYVPGVIITQHSGDGKANQYFLRGLRSEIIPKVETSLLLWQLKLDSELLFVGDAGTTEASRPSKRTGIEWTNHYKLFLAAGGLRPFHFAYAVYR